MISIDKLKDCALSDYIHRDVDVDNGDYLTTVDTLEGEMKLNWVKEHINKLSIGQLESLSK